MIYCSPRAQPPSGFRHCEGSEGSGSFVRQSCSRLSVCLYLSLHGRAVSNHHEVRVLLFPLDSRYFLPACHFFKYKRGPPTRVVPRSLEIWENSMVVTVLTPGHCVELTSKDIKGLIRSNTVPLAPHLCACDTRLCLSCVSLRVLMVGIC